MAALDGVIPAIIGAANSASADFEIQRSLRFNDADTPELTRTPSSTSNTSTFTLSFWVKRCKLGSTQMIVQTGDTYANLFRAYWDGNDNFVFHQYNGSYVMNYITSAKYRDVGAWYHYVIALDTTQAAAADRAKLYVNGAEITDFSATTNPALNLTTGWNAAIVQRIGREYTTTYGNYYNYGGYLAEFYNIDGQQLAASDFGEYDSNNVWQPKEYSGTYGSNGFYLKFADNSSNAALGTDSSGNGNTFTVTNFQVADGAAVTVGAANGGLPIRNTSGDQGGTPVSGFRSDSFADDLFLALPLNTNTSDVSNSINSGSTTKTTTNQSTATSSTQARFYGASSYWNANTDGILVAESGSELVVGTGDFTIELWFYDDSNHSGGGSGRCYLFDNRIGGSVVGDPPTITGYVDGSSDIKYGSSGGGTITSSQGTDGVNNKWFHFAAVRNSGTTTLYINGTSVGSHSDTTNYTNNGFGIGRATDGGYGWAGYIQDFRVYKTAKYTSDFNIPAEANPTLGVGCDSLIDTPTNYTADSGNNGGNYATINSLSTSSTLANGNLQLTTNSGIHFSTIGVSSGKWYAEWTATSAGSTQMVGISKGVATGSYLGANTDGFGYYGSNGQKYNGGGTSYGATYGDGDVIGVALNLDDGNIVFYKNGTSQGTAFTGLSSGTYFFAGGESSMTGHWNFGQRPFAISSVPTGHLSFCTQNFTDPTISDGSTAFNLELFTGNGSTQAITGYGFSPDFCWIKARSAAYFHRIYDTVRGATKEIYPDDTAAQNTVTNGLTSFDSDGFSLGSSAGVNENTTTYVAWGWDAGTTTSTNNDGSTQSSVRVSTTNGFSIATWTGAGAITTVGHGLGAVPALCIIKKYNGTSPWYVWHQDLGGSGWNLQLQSSNARTDNSDIFSQGGSFTSSVIPLGAVGNVSGGNLAYTWSAVEGYSSFGKYTGNGSSDGPFLYTGFRPRWVMIKSYSNSGEHWLILDTKRDPHNLAESTIYANLQNAEADAAVLGIDILSNGFKCIGTNAGINASGYIYIYAAFAEHPFKTSRAR